MRSCCSKNPAQLLLLQGKLWNWHIAYDNDWSLFVNEGNVLRIHKGGEGSVIIYELTETDKGCLRATISDMGGFSTNVLYNCHL